MKKKTKFIIEKSTVRIDPLLLDIYGSFISKHNHTVLNQFKLINHIDSNVDILSIPNVKKQFYDLFSFVRFCNYDIYWLDMSDGKLVCNIVTFDNLKDFYTTEVKSIPGFSSYYASTWGGVYKYNLVDVGNAESNGYYLPKLVNDLGEIVYIAKHRLIAKTFLSTYKEDLVVHHIDGNKHNNSVDNLLPMTSSEHSKLHANPTYLTSYIETHGPYNKGMKMSTEYCEKCKQSALKRWEKG